MNRRFKDQELSIELTKAAKDYIIEGGYDPVYGARPLKRYVQKYVETLTAKLILSGDISTDSRIILDVENGELTAHAEEVQPSQTGGSHDTKRSGNPFELCKHTAP